MCQPHGHVSHKNPYSLLSSTWWSRKPQKNVILSLNWEFNLVNTGEVLHLSATISRIYAYNCGWHLKCNKTGVYFWLRSSKGIKLTDTLHFFPKNTGIFSLISPCFPRKVLCAYYAQNVGISRILRKPCAYMKSLQICLTVIN